MRNDQLFFVLENIDERYIDESENYKAQKKDSDFIRLPCSYVWSVMDMLVSPFFLSRK